MAELLDRITKTPPSPRSINPAIPEAVDQIVMRCLQPTPTRASRTRWSGARADHLTPDGHLRADRTRSSTVKSRPLWQLAAAAAVIVALAGAAGG